MDGVNIFYKFYGENMLRLWGEILFYSGFIFVFFSLSMV